MTVGSPRPASFSRTNLRVNLDGVSVSPSTHLRTKNQTQTQNQRVDCVEEKPLEAVHPAEEEEEDTTRQGNEIMSFHLLPYDLLLNIASYLEYFDVHVLQLTCKSLYYSFTTRPVYRKLATDLLRRCRPLPLKGFQRLGDLSTNRLIYSVNKAHQYEHAWLVRAPRPIGSITATVAPATDSITHNNYLDRETLEGSTAIRSSPKPSWYKVVRAPPGEEVDWLSPITSSYTLCATKSGKVVCWDVQTDTCLAEWNPGERWELWKCRVEFEDKTVYFTMAKVLHGSNSYDDSRIMEFSLMQLQFYENALGKKTACPTFSHVTSFKTVGVVMNIFLLDPSARLLSAFVWVSSSNTIGLYVLLDWEKDEYVFVDTGIECVMSSNWSCILFQQNIVIHCEDSDAAFQHFYPFALLEKHSRKLKTKKATPTLSGRLIPAESIVKRFQFPVPRLRRLAHTNAVSPNPITVIDSQTGAIVTVTTSIAAAPHTSATPSNTNSTSAVSSLPSSSTEPLASTWPSSPLSNTHPLPHQPQAQAMLTSPSPSPIPMAIANPNPYPFPPWYPESAHFVRQWWPTLPNVPRISCTVVLLASHDPVTHKTKFVLAQHYFRVPMRGANWVGFVERGKAWGGRMAGNGSNGYGNENGGTNGGAGADNEDRDDGMSNGTYATGIAATAGSSSSAGTPVSNGMGGHGQAMGPMQMHYLDGPPENSVVAPFYEESYAEASSSSSSTPTFGYPSVGGGATVPAAVAGTSGSPIGWTVNGSSSLTPSTATATAKGKTRELDPSTDRDPTLSPEADSMIDDDAMRLWYVSTPFEVVCLEDPSLEEDEADVDGVQERPRPLVAVDFGHAVWIEYYDPKEGARDHHRQQRSQSREEEEDRATPGSVDEDSRLGMDEVDTPTDEFMPLGHSIPTTTATQPDQDEPREEHKRLRFVTFPPFTDDGRIKDIHGGWGGAEVRTLEIPDELDLHSIETINIDQSQGAIILSMREGKIFILCYE
ncbi:hypothetical protein C8R42DRAFT_726301 [Lentinula raphanica]|nr:hypothetical protein C8R42DRAFT_726301 [Lentinula raphanica]